MAQTPGLLLIRAKLFLVLPGTTPLGFCRAVCLRSSRIRQWLSVWAADCVFVSVFQILRGRVNSVTVK